jgi:hypothetical protein
MGETMSPLKSSTSLRRASIVGSISKFRLGFLEESPEALLAGNGVLSTAVTRPNGDYCLTESQQSILVFPGGNHEVMKHSSLPAYLLLWKQRLGFAHAAKSRTRTTTSYDPIIPVASIGIEDSVDIVFDIPLLGLCRKVDLGFPGCRPTWPHRLQQRIYYILGHRW